MVPTSPPILWIALILLLVLPPVTARAQSADAGANLHLSVVDGHHGLPVHNASLRLAAMGGDEFEIIQPTDGRGEVRLLSVPGGFYRVDVAPEGFATESFTMVVPVEGEVFREFRLLMTHELSTIDVEGERMIESLAVRGFYDRRRSGFGRFLIRSEIERTRPTRVSDILLRLPNVTVRNTGVGIAVYNPGATDASSRGLCLFNIYVDGSNMVTPEGLFDGDIVAIDDILAVEVFNRAHHAPPRFRGSGCGTILIWTGRER